MNCEQVRERLDAFVNGALSGEQSRAVRRHLASCAVCASNLSPTDWVEVLPVFDEAIEPSEDFALRFHARLRERRYPPKSRWRALSAWGRPWQLLGAGALAALMMLGIFLGRHPGGGAADRPESLNDIAVAENLPLLRDMAVISNLDMLEDFDAIEDLRPEGSKAPRSAP